MTPSRNDSTVLSKKLEPFPYKKPIVLLAAAGMALSLGTAWFSAEFFHQRQEASFQKRIDQSLESLRSQIYTAEVFLSSARHFVRVSPPGEIRNFQNFVRPSLNAGIGFQELEWLEPPTLKSPAPWLDSALFTAAQDAKALETWRTEISSAAEKAFRTGQPVMTDLIKFDAQGISGMKTIAFVFLTAGRDPLANEPGDGVGLLRATLDVGERLRRWAREPSLDGITYRFYEGASSRESRLFFEKAGRKGEFEKKHQGLEVTALQQAFGKSWTVVFRAEKNPVTISQILPPGILITGLLLTVWAAFGLHAYGEKKKTLLLEKASLRDDLTGLVNRRGLNFLAEEQFRLSRRHKTALALFVADLNHLKKINHRFGDSEGDRAIRAAAHLIRKSFRESDIAARMGGGEFAVLAIQADPEKLRGMLEKLQMAFTAYNEDRMHAYALGVTLGFACALPGQERTLESLFEEADKALAENKIFKPALEVKT